MMRKRWLPSHDILSPLQCPLRLLPAHPEARLDISPQMRPRAVELGDPPLSHPMQARFRSLTSRGVLRLTQTRWPSGDFEIETAPGVAHILVAPQSQLSIEAAIFANITSDIPNLSSAGTTAARRLQKADFPARRTAQDTRRSTIQTSRANGKAVIGYSPESIIW